MPSSTTPAYQPPCGEVVGAVNRVLAAGDSAPVGHWPAGWRDGIWSSNWGGAQSFVVLTSGPVTHIYARFDTSYGSPQPNATWSVRTNNRLSSGYFHMNYSWYTVTDIDTPGTVLASGLVTPVAGGLAQIVPNNLNLTTGTTYWLVIEPTAQMYWSAWQWRRGGSTYANGFAGDKWGYDWYGTPYFSPMSDKDMDFAVSIQDPTCAQTPQPPSALTPDNDGKVAVSWASVTGAQYYELELYPTGTSCSDPAAQCRTFAQGNYLGAGVTSYTFTPTKTDYTFRVRGVNTTCGGVLGYIYGEWTPNTRFLVRRDVSGTFYLDDSLSSVFDVATGKCTPGGTGTQDMSGQGNIQAVNGGTTTPGTISGSTYEIQNVTSGVGTSISLTVDPLLWGCSCPAGCTYASLPSGNNFSNMNFYVVPPGNPWWQTQNGLLYAGAQVGTAMKSDVPVTCSPGRLCQPYLSLQDTAKQVLSSGIEITGGGSITARSTTLSQDNRADTALGLQETGAKEDYAYFTNQLLSIGAAPSTDFTGAKPSSPPINQKAYFSDGDVTTQGIWDVAAGESLIIVVKGNLTIADQIHVANGGFLAFIVSGNIVVVNTVGQAASTSVVPVVEGIYYADGTVTIQGGRPAGDLKFVGAGSFIGRGGVQLDRTYTPARSNLTAPTDLFIFRPDLILNMPIRLQRPLILWQEAN